MGYIIRTILFFCLIYSYGFAFSLSNLVPNPGFEYDKNKDNMPDCWHISPHAQGIFKIEPKGKTGKCISLFGKGSFYCRIKGIKKNKYYLFSFWIKRDGWKEGEYPKIRLFNKELYLNNVIGWGDWIKVSFLIDSENNNSTYLYLINPGLSHKIYFDEISLKEFTPLPLSPCGDVDKSFLEFVWSLPSNNYVLKPLVEISRSLDFKSSITIEGKKGSNRIISHFPLDGGKWFWRVKIYRNNKLVATSVPASFILKSFFPIGIYGVPTEYFEDIKKAGFNSICLGGDIIMLRNNLSHAYKYNLKALISMSFNRWDEALLRFIKDMRYSSNILAWYLEDEPEIRFVSPLYIWKLSEYIKRLDPSHPTLITLVRAKRVEDYGDCADIIMVDPYPIPRRPVTWLSESIDKVKEEFPYKPVWAVIQAFDWSAFPYGEEKRRWGRDPTYEEKRCLTYLAIIHGARGLFYYVFKSKNYFIIKRKRHWQELKKIIKELNYILPIIKAPKIFPLDSVGYSGKVHYIVKYVSKGNMRGYYLLLVNTSSHPLDVKIDLPSLAVTHAKEIFRKKEYPILNNSLALHFDKYEVQIYLLYNHR